MTPEKSKFVAARKAEDPENKTDRAPISEINCLTLLSEDLDA
jgi:hypothetical protein